jgi:phage N-6-adenine-methyltransferase
LGLEIAEEATPILSDADADGALREYVESVGASSVEQRRVIATAPRNKWSTNQRIGTPWAFFNPLTEIFKFAVDLSADESNTKCPRYISPHLNSLSDKVEWHKLAEPGSWLWLNPPFNEINKWAQKCKREARLGAKIVMITPASVGSGWFLDNIFGQAVVVLLRGRVTFDYVIDKGKKKGQWNTDPYPKDCMLSIFTPPGLVPPQITWADWKNSLAPVRDAMGEKGVI